MEAMTTACERQRRGRVHYFQGVEDGLEEVRCTYMGWGVIMMEIGRAHV